MTYLLLFLAMIWAGFAVEHLTGIILDRVHQKDYGWITEALQVVMFAIHATASIACLTAAGVI